VILFGLILRTVRAIGKYFSRKQEADNPTVEPQKRREIPKEDIIDVSFTECKKEKRDKTEDTSAH
jgi:hypothetical protein